MPENKDLTLTIDSAQWESVKNPITNTTEAKRVIRFKEKGVKPFICNQTNAQSILKSTGVKHMEDSEGFRIQLYIGSVRDNRTKEDVDCIRIRRSETKTLTEIYNEIKTLFDLVKSNLSEKEAAHVQRVIDNEEIISYEKALVYLNCKKDEHKQQ